MYFPNLSLHIAVGVDENLPLGVGLLRCPERIAPEAVGVTGEINPDDQRREQDHRA